MGRDKALLRIGGQPLVVRMASIAEPVVSSVKIVGPPERYETLGLNVIADRNFSTLGELTLLQGPLAGIATALAATDTGWNLIMACDLPYLTREWVDWLLARTTNCQHQIVMPRTPRGPEPLAAVYHRDCADRIARLLARGVRKVVEALEDFQVDFVFERDWQAIDPKRRVLRNMNTPADYEEALALLEKP